MKNLAEWITRLQRVNEDPKALMEMEEHYFRAITPGFKPLELKDCLLGTNAIGKLQPRPGDSTPLVSTLIRFMDVKKENPDPLSHSIIEDIAALLTLSTNRRVDISPELTFKEENNPEKVTFLGYGDAVDWSLVGPIVEPAAKPFLNLLSKVASLSEPHLSTIGTACQLHYGAAILCGRDVRSAYLLLVAAIEVLSRQYGLPPKNWEQWEDHQKWEKFMASLEFSEAQRESLKNQLLSDKHLKLKATFKHYAASRLPDAFWDEDWKGWSYTTNITLGQWTDVKLQHSLKVRDFISDDREFLEQLLGVSYDLRSGLVHKGDKFTTFDAAIYTNTHLEPKKHIPFASLRAILVALIKAELDQYSSEISIPQIIHIAPEYTKKQTIPKPPTPPKVNKPNRAARRASAKKWKK